VPEAGWPLTRASRTSASAAKYWILRQDRLVADLRHQPELVDHLALLGPVRTAASAGSFGDASLLLPQGASTLKGMTVDEDDARWEMRSEIKRRTWKEVINGVAPRRVVLDTEWADGTWEATIRSCITDTGERIDGYTITAMAQALHRAPVTIRRLERTGLLPPAPFRSEPIIALDGTVIRTGQRRLYRYEHIAGLAQIWADERLDRSFRRIRHTSVTARAFRLYAALAASRTA
jgi:hypothetical protein